MTQTKSYISFYIPNTALKYIKAFLLGLEYDDSSSINLRMVEYSLVAIATKYSLGAGVVIPVRVPYIDQLDLFTNHSISSGPCAKK